jgi:hypothetical protein
MQSYNCFLHISHFIWQFLGKLTVFINSKGWKFSYRYKSEMLEDVPRIFEAVFQCTLEVGIVLLSYMFMLLYSSV